MAPSVFVYYLFKMSIPLLGRIFIVEKVTQNCNIQKE